MKRIFFIKNVVVILIHFSITTAFAQTITVKVDSIFTSEYTKNIHFVDLVICNELPDTIYLPQNNLYDGSGAGYQFFFSQEEPFYAREILVNNLEEDYSFEGGLVRYASKQEMTDLKVIWNNNIALVNELNKQHRLIACYNLNCFRISPKSKIKIRIFCRIHFLNIKKFGEIGETKLIPIETRMALPLEYYSNKELKKTILVSEHSEKLKNYLIYLSKSGY